MILDFLPTEGYNKKAVKNSIEVWLSLVERFVRDEEAVGSNPVTSTSKLRMPLAFGAFPFPLL